MKYQTISRWLPCVFFLGIGIETFAATLDVPQVVNDPISVLRGAEERFVQPTESWFYETQAALRSELDRVGAILDAQGPEYAAPWKRHFYWEQLQRNLGPVETVDVDEIALSRRWMYSNRKGTEYPLFAGLRTATDAYLDAAYTLSHFDLHGEYLEKVALARTQLQALRADPSDTNAAALGRTFGWLEKTRQLTDEIAVLRAALSHPNLQLVVSKPLVKRIMSTQDTDVEHNLAVRDTGQTPTTRRFQRSRTVHVRGHANTEGDIALEIVPNSQLAELNIVYHGEVTSNCHATAGPVSFNIHTEGPVSAFTPVTFGPEGIVVQATAVQPHVRTSISNVSAKRRIVQRIGNRRVNEPESRAMIEQRSREKTIELLTSEMDERVGSAIDDIRSEISRMRNTMGRFSEIFAPVVREGANPVFASTQSSERDVTLNIYEGRREQFGAARPCPESFPQADIVGQMHVSFINNLLETIMGGKMFTDEYFMKYAKILQPTLPLDLMVHTRATRWAIIADNPRPLQMEIPESNHFRLTLKISALEVDGYRFTAPTQATVSYQLQQNEFGDYFLRREGDVQLDSELNTHHRELLHKKLSAFFAPILDGGGLVIPEGGAVGALNSLELIGVQATDDWLAMGYKVPQELVESFMSSDRSEASSSGTDENKVLEQKLPPPYAVDDTLNTYPGIR